MNRVADRSGNIKEEQSLQDRFLEWMYGHAAGRMLLRPLVCPAFSQMGGRLLSTGLSAFLIRPFIRMSGIDMSDYEKRKYTSYNDFFTRQLVSGARSIDPVPEHFISPCDSRLSVYRINEGDDGRCAVNIKYTRYTVASLLKSRRLTAEYAGGYLWVFRLCVDDYHRYSYVDDGTVSAGRRIPGVFHTVNPVANDVYPIYKENTREYSFLESRQFGTILQMEVGALLVGKIENHVCTGPVRRGQEKGHFAFGGSTVILMTKKGKVCPDRDILENSKKGIETRVLLGEKVGYAVYTTE
ncbi:MAG: phosphatidylserine decarboxylase [Lachnospiraceae bacterium]